MVMCLVWMNVMLKAVCRALWTKKIFVHLKELCALVQGQVERPDWRPGRYHLLISTCYFTCKLVCIMYNFNYLTLVDLYSIFLRWSVFGSLWWIQTMYIKNCKNDTNFVVLYSRKQNNPWFSRRKKKSFTDLRLCGIRL